MIFLTLIQNIALLVALSVVHSQIMRRRRTGTIIYPILSGLLFGSVGVIGMMTPLRLMPGIIFDGRSIVLSIAGFFGGPIPGCIAGAICAAYRAWLGGAGAIMGVSVITESVCVGILFHYLRRKYTVLEHPLSLLGFGFLVHVIMVALSATIQGGASREVFQIIVFPVLTIYPAATLLVCLLFLDQEARLKAEKALQESEQNYREIFNSINEAILIHDSATGRILDVNEPMLRMFGYSRKIEMLNRTISELSLNEPPYTQKEAEAYIQKVLTEGLAVFEWHARKKNGTLFWIEMSLRNSRIGGEGRILNVSRDITDRKQAELEKTRLEEQLRQAQKIESVGRLAGGVAHDFNNMLSVIIGHTEMVLDQLKPGDPYHSNLQEILKAAQRSADLTRQLLAFARKQSISPKLLDLNEIISSMQTMLQRLIGEHIQLVWKPGNNLGFVKIDPTQIHQILANLVVNARDAISEQGTITIETSLPFFDPNTSSSNHHSISHKYILLTVHDTGIGMNRETMENIFDPFFTTKGVGEGTGLGLATVYGIMEQNQGFIQVSSQPGAGSTFYLYFPRHDSNDIESPPDPTSSNPKKGTETILLVEDEEMIMRMGKDILEKGGYRVLPAHGPTEALELVSHYPDEIHLLITDVVMPEMNGKELKERIDTIKPGIQCLFMSGYPSDIITHRGIIDDGIHFIQKPFTSEEFFTIIRKVLEKNCSAESVPPPSRL